MHQRKAHTGPQRHIHERAQCNIICDGEVGGGARFWKQFSVQYSEWLGKYIRCPTYSAMKNFKRTDVYMATQTLKICRVKR